MRSTHQIVLATDTRKLIIDHCSIMAAVRMYKGEGNTPVLRELRHVTDSIEEVLKGRHVIPLPVIAETDYYSREFNVN